MGSSDAPSNGLDDLSCYSLSSAVSHCVIHIHTELTMFRRICKKLVVVVSPRQFSKVIFYISAARGSSIFAAVASCCDFVVKYRSAMSSDKDVAAV